MSRIYIGEFDTFEELRKFCEFWESKGYFLNVFKSCYER